MIDDLNGEEIRQFLEEHLSDMRATSPPESVHALDLEGLRAPEVTFWTIYAEGELVGCGALKELDAQHGEIKSMRTSALHRGTGAGTLMLSHLLDEARKRGYSKLMLETGSMAFFEPARRLYEKAGFIRCGPFADYTEDPNSVYYEYSLTAGN